MFDDIVKDWAKAELSSKTETGLFDGFVRERASNSFGKPHKSQRPAHVGIMDEPQMFLMGSFWTLFGVNLHLIFMQ